MKTGFLEKVRQGRAVDDSRVLGYSDAELSKLGRLYDISITGDFRAFMLEMGRCSGGLIGDNPIILYREFWDVRTQILTQFGFFDDLQNAGLYSQMQPKPFVFSIEWETQYYFLFTGGSNPDIVYHFDENSSLLRCTDLPFAEYISAIVRSQSVSESSVICQGELLEI